MALCEVKQYYLFKNSCDLKFGSKAYYFLPETYISKDTANSIVLSLG